MQNVLQNLGQVFATLYSSTVYLLVYKIYFFRYLANISHFPFKSLKACIFDVYIIISSSNYESI